MKELKDYGYGIDPLQRDKYIDASIENSRISGINACVMEIQEVIEVCNGIAAEARTVQMLEYLIQRFKKLKDK